MAAFPGIQPSPPKRANEVARSSVRIPAPLRLTIRRNAHRASAGAIAIVDRVLLAIFGVEDDVVAVLDEIAEAMRQRDARLVAVVLGRLAVRRLGDGADEILLEDDVDDAGDRVGAVDRRGAILQHFDPLDHFKRNLVQVDKAALRVVGEHRRRDAATVEKNEGGVRAQAAERDAGRRGAGRNRDRK